MVGTNKHPKLDSRKQDEKVRTICSFIRLPSSSMVRILKSMPIVVMKEGVHASSQNLSRRQDFPTPVGPNVIRVVHILIMVLVGST